MELSLVVPVWNDLPGLDRLLQQVADLDVFSQIIIADDASDEPPGPHNVPAALPLAQRLVWLRSETRRGAGHARNMALGHLRGDHVIFFDSDDLFTADFPRIVAQAKASEPFDFLIFRHHDSRMLSSGGGPLASDENRWRSLQLGEDPLQLSPAQALGLVQVAAYPWNKIYRTDFLRENAIRCTETMVHNDIELHWASFTVADRILASNIAGAVHFVTESGNRLTNQRSLERLEVFRACHGIMQRITTSRDIDRLGFLLPFAQFSSNLLHWIEENLDEEYRPELQKRAREFYLSALDPVLMTLIAYRDSGLARKINRAIVKGQDS